MLVAIALKEFVSVARSMNKMGISKLTSFINTFFTGWKEEKLGNYLVIDGCSLHYHLYNFHWIQGGQYTDYRSAIMKFFGALRSSAVESIVVIDGYDYPEEKSDTVKKRNDAKARKVCNQFSMAAMADSNISSRVSARLAATNVLPPLAPNVFQEVLCELNVTCIMVDGEADDEIVRLANFYCCPVLSNDSDFYMFPLKCGFIQLNMLNWRAHPVTAKVYHMDVFLKQFKLAHESLRFIIPAICGNDFLSAFAGRYLEHIKQVALCSMGKCHLIKYVIEYASHYDDLQDFVARIKSGCTDYFNNNGKDRLIDNCMKAQLQYDIKDVVSLEDLNSSTRLSLVTGHPLPNWLLRQIRGCNYSAGLLMMICEGGCCASVPVGDPSKESARYVSLPLRQAFYSLLELHPFVFEEMFDRFEMVDIQVYTRVIVCEGEVITLDMLADLDLRKRKKLLYYFLHSNGDLIESLEEKWRLVIASVIYWTRAASIPILMIKILILTFVLCSRGKAALKDPLKIYQRVKINYSFINTPTWWEGLHYFTQWQCSYDGASSLSLILQLPLPIYSAGHIFNNKLVMYFLQYTNDVSVAVSKLPNIDRQLYDQLLTTVLSHKSELYKAYTSITLCDEQTDHDHEIWIMPPEAPTCPMSLFNHHVIE